MTDEQTIFFLKTLAQINASLQFIARVYASNDEHEINDAKKLFKHEIQRFLREEKIS